MFDTHYPEYFPVRKGFNASLAAMQELGVKVAPYINGRIFDKGTKSWTVCDTVTLHHLHARLGIYANERPRVCDAALQCVCCAELRSL